MATYDDIDTSTLGLVAVWSALITFLMVVGAQVLYFNFDKSIQAERVIAQPEIKSDDVLNQQRGKLQSYAWVDRNKNQVAIPIDKAMEMVVRDLSAPKGDDVR
jgi:hypothetical protein